MTSETPAEQTTRSPGCMVSLSDWKVTDLSKTPVLKECQSRVNVFSDSNRTRPSTLRRSKGVDRAARRDRDVLLAIHCESHRRGIDRSTHLKVPKRFQCGCIEGDEVSFGVAAEDKAAGC